MTSLQSMETASDRLAKTGRRVDSLAGTWTTAGTEIKLCCPGIAACGNLSKLMSKQAGTCLDESLKLIQATCCIHYKLVLKRRNVVTSRLKLFQSELFQPFGK